MSDTCDFIPCADVVYGSSEDGDSAGGSGSSGSAAVAASLLLDHASCTGSSSAAAAAPCDDGGGMQQQDTPDYIRRGVAARHRIVPLELFSTPSPLVEPSHATKAAAAAAVLEVPAAAAEVSKGKTLHIEQGNRDCCSQLKQEYDSLLREKGECRRLLEDLMRENELKSRECREAQASLHDLQMELMRKSMHVGSLAFAVEGQVKEKNRWCQLLKDLSEKFKALKLEHQILLKESMEYKKCLADATQMTTTIHQYVNQYASLECEFKELKEKFIDEAKERKDLYNKLIELKEIAEGASMAVDFESAKDGELIVRGHVSSKNVF